MKHILILTSIILFSSATSTLFAQQNSFIKDYLERLENSRKYLILVAETMSEENHRYENAMAERINGILKDEFFLDHTFSSTKHAQTATKVLSKFIIMKNTPIFGL